MACRHDANFMHAEQRMQTAGSAALKPSLAKLHYAQGQGGTGTITAPCLIEKEYEEGRIMGHLCLVSTCKLALPHECNG